MGALVRLLVVDNQPLFVRGLLEVLEEKNNIMVVGIAYDGATGIALCREYHPDILLLGLELMDTDGLTLLRLMLQEEPQMRIVVLAMEESVMLVQEAFEVGVHGYLMKTANASLVHQMFDKVIKGQKWIDPRVRSKVPPLLNSSRRRKRRQKDLTTRKKEIARLILKHRGSISKVAAELYSSQSCVRYHLSNIYRKLGCHGMADLLLQLSKMEQRQFILERDRSDA